MRRTLKLALGCWWLLWFCPSYAEVKVIKQNQYYLIDPQSTADIKRQLRQHSPVAKDNQLFHGGTQWQIIPLFAWQQVGNLCRIAQVEVELHTTFTLPKLKDSASAEIKNHFNRYVNALKTHEMGHHQIGEKAANRIYSLLNRMPPHMDCQALTNIAKQRVKDVIAEYQALNQDYDNDTGHGRSQGAVIR